jgi:hypothetical protein
MIIQRTKIPDVVEKNIDESKLFLANNIIKNVYPLFTEVYNERKKNIILMKEELNKKQETIIKIKDELKMLMREYEKKKKIHNLLEKIKQLVNSGISNDGSLKHEMVVLVKVVNKLSPEKIESNLKETSSLLAKRFL